MLDTLLRSLLWPLLAAMLCACASSVDEPTPGPAEGSTMQFKFTIFTDDAAQRAGARSSRAPGVWEENAANVAERILSISDFRVLFFSQSGLLLKSVTPSALDYSGDPTANDGYYNLSVTFAHDYFDQFDPSAEVPFTVMILANLNSIGAEYVTYTPGTTRVADVADSFTMAPDWTPSVTAGIPMFGLRSFRILKSNLLFNAADAPVSGEIDLLRSLCKIEVTDKITNSALFPDGVTYPRILGVEMASWNDRGYIRPARDNYTSPGLTEANIYPVEAPAQTPVGVEPVDGTFRFYCPEAEMADMKFRVTAQLLPGEEPRVFETDLSPYAAAIGSELVRNHIYRFDIHALSTMAELDVTVSDWQVQTDRFELDDIVSVEPDGFLRWSSDGTDIAVTTESYNGVAERLLSFLNGTEDYATGTFHLISPRGAAWRAYFIPGENGVDAFEFVDVDADGNVIPGSASVIAEGTVGSRATIRVRGKGAADAYRHWAEMVIEVRQPDGTILYAPLTPEMSSRFIVYRENKL